LAAPTRDPVSQRNSLYVGVLPSDAKMHSRRGQSGVTGCHVHTEASNSRGAELELLEDQLSALLVTEESYLVLHIPCKAIALSSDSRPLGEEWRQKICQWSFRVIDHFRLDREIVSFGLNLFDRYLVTNCLDKQARQSNRNKIRSGVCSCPSCGQSIDSATYQLAAMTSLYVAIKLHPDNKMLMEDGTRRKRHFKLESFVELSRGQFQAQDICRMEQVILEALKWKVNPPTPMALVAYLLSMMPSIDDIPSASRSTYDLVLHVLQELSRYITELSVCLGNLCSTFPPSQVAYAAILVSMDLLTYKALPMRVRNTFHAAVSMISLQSEGTLLMQHKPRIVNLSHILSKSLLPDMLLEEYDRESQATSATSKKGATPSTATTSTSSSACHPIVIARDYGLLNLTRINSRSWQEAPTTASVGVGVVDDDTPCQPSPTGVIHGCY
jgi:Cyclin, N-terminal domain